MTGWSTIVAHTIVPHTIVSRLWSTYVAQSSQFIVMDGLLTLAKELGIVLRELRIGKGLSQEKLALESGLNRSYVPKIERGDRMPTVATVFALSKALGIDPAVLIHRLKGRSLYRAAWLSN